MCIGILQLCYRALHLINKILELKYCYKQSHNCLSSYQKATKLFGD